METNNPYYSYQTPQINPLLQVEERPSVLLAHRPSNNFPIGWFVLAVVLAIVCLVLLFLYIRDLIVLIEPSKCPVLKYPYAIQADVVKPVLRNCGGVGANSPCLFPANSLQQAIEVCNSQPTICQEFNYDSTLSQMAFVDSAAIGTIGNLDLYIRQMPTTVIVT